MKSKFILVSFTSYSKMDIWLLYSRVNYLFENRAHYQRKNNEIIPNWGRREVLATTQWRELYLHRICHPPGLSRVNPQLR